PPPDQDPSLCHGNWRNCDDSAMETACTVWSRADRCGIGCGSDYGTDRTSSGCGRILAATGRNSATTGICGRADLYLPSLATRRIRLELLPQYPHPGDLLRD